MTTIEKAIERMKKVEAACNELLEIVEPDIAELKKRREGARKMIEGFTVFAWNDESKYRLLAEQTAINIVEAKLRPVSCMGVSIKIT